jgi:signal transduction histidine kinase
LAKSRRGHHAAEFVDLATACEDSLEQVSDQVKRRELQVTASLRPAELTGDRVLLERMVGNLVDNAARYAKHGGWVKLACGRRDDRAYLEVANSSEPLPDDLVPLLLEPFRRAADRVGDSGGAGLGLAIVKAVADLHHGTVALQGRDGGGLSVVVQIPVGPQDQRADQPRTEWPTRRPNFRSGRSAGARSRSRQAQWRG